MPLPPVYQGVGRPGHYMASEETLTKYASDKYTRKDAAPLPSVLAAEIYEKATKDAPFEPFPEAELDDVVRHIRDSDIGRDQVRTYFSHLRSPIRAA